MYTQLSREFVDAIDKGSNLDDVRKRMVERAQAEYNSRINEILAMLRDAELIRVGLSQPAGSASYEIASAIMAEAHREKNSSQKGGITNDKQ